MLIARFGDSWVSAYEFPLVYSGDDWLQERPAIITPVGGSGGAFDFYGLNLTDAENYPPGPMQIVKTFTVSSATYAGVETTLDTIRSNTIAADATFLWGQKRGGTTVTYRRFCWAKCTSMRANEVQARPFVIDVELTFIAPEGLWYGVTGATIPNGQDENEVVSGYPWSETHTVNNAGNYPALLSTFVDMSGGAWDEIALENTTNGANWSWSGDPFDQLEVDALAYECLADGADAYASLTIGTGQVAWMWLDPGNNSLEWSSNSGGAGRSLDIYYIWYDTYLM